MMDMIQSILIRIFNMSVSAAYLVVAVLLLRLIFKKAPKNLRLILWGFVGLRLVLPFSLKSITSIIPSTQTIPRDIAYVEPPHIQSGIGALNSAVNPVIAESYESASIQSASPVNSLLNILSIVWLVGIAAMLLYGVISYAMLRYRVKPSIKMGGSHYICDNISSPFILGIFRPKIYLPSDITDEQSGYVLAHERAHIARHDNISKAVGFILLCVHWFNPFVWVSYLLFCRDTELACDERVIGGMDDQSKKGYLETLLSLSLPKRSIALCPLSFSEVSVKQRIKSALSFKKPAVWVIIAAVVVCAAVAVCFLTDPLDRTESKKENNTEQNTEVPQSIVPHNNISEVSKPISETNQSETRIESSASYLDYVCHETPEPITGMLRSAPRILLSTNSNRFRFIWSMFSSYIAEGTYEIEGTTLTLTTDDRLCILTFSRDKDGYTFVADKSSSVPQYSYAEGEEPQPPFEDGALFYEYGEYVESFDILPDAQGKSYLKWKDRFIGDETPSSGYAETTIPEFPDTTFKWDFGSEVLSATVNGETTILCGGVIMSVYFSDINGDDLPEILVGVSVGSGIVDHRIVVYDYANKKRCGLSDRMKHDYVLYTDKDKLKVQKTDYPYECLKSTGTLAITETDGQYSLQFVPDEVRTENLPKYYDLNGDGRAEKSEMYDIDSDSIEEQIFLEMKPWSSNSFNVAALVCGEIKYTGYFSVPLESQLEASFLRDKDGKLQIKTVVHSSASGVPDGIEETNILDLSVNDDGEIIFLKNGKEFDSRR